MKASGNVVVLGSAVYPPGDGSLLLAVTATLAAVGSKAAPNCRRSRSGSWSLGCRDRSANITVFDRDTVIARRSVGTAPAVAG
jgi:hypothetical protein